MHMNNKSNCHFGAVISAAASCQPGMPNKQGSAKLPWEESSRGSKRGGRTEQPRRAGGGGMPDAAGLGGLCLWSHLPWENSPGVVQDHSPPQCLSFPCHAALWIQMRFSYPLNPIRGKGKAAPGCCADLSHTRGSGSTSLPLASSLCL